MEVFIRNVQPQSGNSQLKTFLRPYLDRLSIRSVEVNNHYGKDKASLTFLHTNEAQLFLVHHGQNQRAPNTARSTPIDENLYQQLHFLGKSIYCEKARNEPSPVVLRGLAFEETQRLAGLGLRRAHIQIKFPMIFNASSISIGNLAYEDGQLIFIPQYQKHVNGEAKFGKRSMMLSLSNGIRIDFLYSAVESITTEVEPDPLSIFSMQQNPRLFRKVDNPSEHSQPFRYFQKTPAKCAARIGQAFSDTRVAVHIDPEKVHTDMPDVEAGSCYNFSDGVGTISGELLERIVSELPRTRRAHPTCLQIRYKGAKGMISLDSRLQGEGLCLRASMIKFIGSTSNDIEICEAASKPLPVYLNRQFIKIMEDMGVEETWFMNLQEQEIEQLRRITDNPINAASFLKKQGIGEYFFLPQLITGLDMVGLDFKADGFLANILEVTFLSELRQLKHKTRIPVPKGWHLHGTVDETGSLEEGEIFCVGTIDGMRRVICEDRLLITRAPALHPGDIQVVKGVMPPPDSPLHHLNNCVCFSSKGRRDLPSQFSGGDLDGDRYYVIWDEQAMPKEIFVPAEYPRKPPVDIGRPVKPSDITDFFLNFMETDQLGRIAVGHRVLADQRLAGTADDDCITLAQLDSDAVDFSKTGIPPDMSRMPRYNSSWRPDFEAPGPHVILEKLNGPSFQIVEYEDSAEKLDEDDDFPSYRYYESEKVIGRLYRAIDERKIFEEIKERAEEIDKSSDVIHALWEQILSACKLIQYDHLLEHARGIKGMYESCIQNIAQQYSSHPSRPLSEHEVFTGTIFGRDGALTRTQRELSITMKERFDDDVCAIVDCILKNGGDEVSNERLEMSMACLAVALEKRDGDGDGDGDGGSGEVKGRGRGRGRKDEGTLSFKYVAAAICLREVERLLDPSWKVVHLLEG